MPELEFFINPKMEKQTVYLGRHQLRFKMKCVKELDLKSGDILMVGLDKNEKPLRHLYVLKTDSDSATGFKVILRNNTCTISFKGMYDKLQLQKPCNARYELIKNEKFNGIKIVLPRFSLSNVRPQWLAPSAL